MTTDEFYTLYPEFIESDPAKVQAQIDVFALQYQGDYGSLADHLTGLFVAHQLSIFDNDDESPGQVIKSRSIDGMSWSFETPGSDSKAGAFGSTKYGVEFHRLISLFGGGAVMSGAHLGSL